MSRLDRDIGGLPARKMCATRVGPYRLIREIGSGGMGVIYEAEEEAPRRRVALKLVRHGGLSERAMRRFQREALILAKLHHPGIAPIFNAGITDDEAEGRRPFIAMQLIDGTPLDKYSVEQGLDRRARMALMAAVCDAVQHAHQKGIIHRDLKPANILVVAPDVEKSCSSGGVRGFVTDPAVGQPKVLDFGIARLTDEGHEPLTVATQVGELVGTLAYMSPEQFGSDSGAVDTQSDVYSLGVILYELLTNRRPHELRNASIVEAAGTIQSEDPPRPSSIDDSLRGDVDAILTKAMDRDPRRRYDSAAQLAADIRRSLRDEPIIARQMTTIHHLSRFVRRHRLFMASGVVLVIVLAAGAVGTAKGLVSARKAHAELMETRNALAGSLAEQRSQTEAAQAVLGFLHEDLLQSLAPLAVPSVGHVQMRDLLEEASRRLEQSDRFRNQPAVEASIQRSVGNTYRLLAEFEAAEEHLRQACHLFDEVLGKEAAETIATWLLLALCYYDDQRLSAALDILDRQRKLIGEDSISLRSKCLTQLGAVYARLGRSQEAIAIHESVIELRRAHFGEDDPELLTSMGNLAITLSNIGRLPEAVDRMRDVHKRHVVVLGESDPETLNVLHSLAGMLGHLGQTEEAEQLGRRALELHLDLYGKEHISTIKVVGTLAETLVSRGRIQEAIDLLEPAVEQVRTKVGTHNVVAVRVLLILGQAHSALNRWNEAIALFEETVVEMKAHYGVEVPITWQYMLWLADAYPKVGRNQEACDVLSEYAGLARAGDPVRAIATDFRLSVALMRLGRFEDAETRLLWCFEKAVRNKPYYAGKLVDLYSNWARAEPNEDLGEQIRSWRKRAREGSERRR